MRFPEADSRNNEAYFPLAEERSLAELFRKALVTSSKAVAGNSKARIFTTNLTPPTN
jgi:hypothetical protein